jgi:hypothetical protein
LKKKLVITIYNKNDYIQTFEWKSRRIPNSDESLEWYAHENILEKASLIKDEITSKKIIEKFRCHDMVNKTFLKQA